MEVYVLSSTKPIVKRYGLTPRGRLRQESYPNLHSFKSFEYPINALSELFTVIFEHAKAGNCLLKGELQRPLNMESRAGSTSPDTTTQWICLDFDGIKGFDDIDQALEEIGCGDTDYILQWSASQGIGGSTDLRCHVFMLLHSKEHPTTLKRWLKHLNLSTRISDQLTLTSTANALLWPLDITTCQNDKLLYVAPPIFEDGVQDPFEGKPRITLHERKYRRLELDVKKLPRPDVLATMEHKKLNELRKKADLKPRPKSSYGTDSNIQYLQKPDEAQITGQKSERGFVYFNLNGGDSWGYYHPVENPAFIYNFKGEPTYRTKDLLPTYWAEIKARVQSLEPNEEGDVYLAFRDFNSATYWNGVYSASDNALTKLAQARSESQLRHFMKQHGQPLGDYIPDWDLVFDPHAPYVIDQKHKKVNIYKRSKYFARKPEYEEHVPPTIHKVIFHALGSDQKVYEHFLNWLAVIVQNLSMTGTAWVLHGTQGTGKGVLFNHILTPLFGKDNVTSRRMEELGSTFTEFMKNKFIVFIDEVQAGNSLYHERIAAKLKNLIVEPRISVREMYRPSEIMQNFSNLIFASNAACPVSIAPDDRRFQVGTYQSNPIELSFDEIRDIGSEIGQFYDYLCTRPADQGLARELIDTEDRRRIINTSRPSIEIALEALKRGDLSWFQDMMVQKLEIINPRMQIIYDQYATLVEELVATRRTRLTRDDIMTLMRWCADVVPDSPNKFTALLRHHGLDLSALWVDGKTVRGLEIQGWIKKE